MDIEVNYKQIFEKQKETLERLSVAKLKIVFSWLWQWLKVFKGKILFLITIGVLQICCSLAFVWFSKEIVDIATGSSLGSLRLTAVLVVLFLILNILLNSIDSFVSDILNITVSNKIKKAVFVNIQNAMIEDQIKIHSGDIVTRINIDCQEVTEFISSLFSDTIITLFQLLSSFVFLYCLDKTLAWIILCLTPLFLIFGKFFAIQNRLYNLQQKSTLSNINTLIQENIQHQITIKALELQNYSISRLNNLQVFLQYITLQKTKLTVKMKTIFQTGFGGGYVVAFLWGVYQVSRNNISFGSLTAFLQLVSRVQSPISILINRMPKFISLFSSVERLIELQKLRKEEYENPYVISEPISINVDNLCFKYDKNLILNNISLNINSNCFTAIVGATGCGKTTFAKLLMSLYKPTSGKIILTNCKGTSISASINTRCNFVYVPQGNTLFSGTIKENLLLAKPTATNAELNEVLKIAVADFVYDCSEGIDTQINEMGQGISEGQAQRLCVARALLRDGNIMLFDEITSALDNETEIQLMKNLKQFAQNKTVIFITHKPKVIEFCEHIISFDQINRI